MPKLRANFGKIGCIYLKIQLNLSFNKSTSLNTTIDFELAKLYYEKIKELSNYVQNPISSDIFIQTLRMPDVISSPKEELDEKLMRGYKEALAGQGEPFEAVFDELERGL